jgi:hypothetical protein
VDETDVGRGIAQDARDVLGGLRRDPRAVALRFGQWNDRRACKVRCVSGTTDEHRAPSSSRFEPGNDLAQVGLDAADAAELVDDVRDVHPAAE